MNSSTIPPRLRPAAALALSLCLAAGAGAAFRPLGSATRAETPPKTTAPAKRPPSAPNLAVPVHAPPLPVVSVQVAPPPEYNREGFLTSVGVSRTGDTGQPLTVAVALSGSATAGVDYTVAGNTVTIPAGKAVGHYGIQIVNDDVGEEAETIRVILEAGPGYTIGDKSVATLTIPRNDFVRTVSLSCPPPASSTITEGGAEQVQIFVEAGAPHDVAVSVAIRAEGFQRSVPIAAGEYRKPFLFSLPDDLVAQGERILQPTIQPSQSYDVGAPSWCAVTVRDGPGLPVVRMRLDPNHAFVGEEPADRVTVEVLRLHPAIVPPLPPAVLNVPLVVHYTASGTAVAGVDYVALPGTVTIPAGATSASFDVIGVPDTLDEPDKSLFLQFAPGPGYTIDTVQASVNLTLTDND